MSEHSRPAAGDLTEDGSSERTAIGAVGDAVGGNSVQLSALTKQFDETLAVDGVDLEVDSGELVVLLGPSGCGKTTTLRMVAGLEPITDGTVTIGDRDVSRTIPQDRDVAMVFQSYALYPHKTVRENIRFPLRKTDLDEPAVTERIQSTAALLNIADLLDKQPAALSGGQRQRVAVGRALARNPSVLLMDEPLSNLDAKLRVQTRSELRDLQQRLGITTLYVTHDQEEAMSLADRIAVMNGGRIEQVGTPEEVYRRPNSEFVAAFLGDPSMNVFDVTDEGGPVVDALTATKPPGARRVGIRPEDVYLAGERTEAGPSEETSPIDCRVTVVEPIGRAYELTVEAGGRPFEVRTRSVPESLDRGTSTAVTFDADAMSYFDADGRRMDDG
ncbi:ABC transporter ATP-binding protein [Haloarcula sp. JP-L23]|uniref:ABC transporter ATP-binding protein n=1 Tax=Haloarcula sp. JP-L23 TaxID=2716717 RepID=UPI00140EC66E|nr:ABC transporter ATP-binding protein [Haloarcula sp. JP-L23]